MQINQINPILIVFKDGEEGVGVGMKVSKFSSKYFGVEFSHINIFNNTV